MARAALRLAERGFHVFPVHTVRPGGVCSCGAPHCERVGKHPRTKHGLKDATKDPKQIAAWWLEWPDANIGLVPWLSRHVVIDVDPRNGGTEGLAELEAQHGLLPDTARVFTGGGGFHIYLTVPDGCDHVPSRLLRPGVELKAMGSYVLAPPSTHLSVHLGAAPATAGPGYAWDTALGDHMVDAPFWLVEAPPKGKVYARSGRPPIEGLLGAAFTHAGMTGRMLGPDKVAVQCPWESDHSQGSRFDSSTVVFGPCDGKNLGHFHCSHSHCLSRSWKDVLDALPKQSVEHAKEVVPKAAKVVAGTAQEEWEKLLARRSSGEPSKDPGNLMLMMENLPEWKGIIAFDESRGKMIWRRNLPDVPGAAPSHDPRANKELRDGDWIDVAHWFRMVRSVTFSKDTISDVLQHVGNRSRFNSLAEHIAKLPAGKGLLDDWLVRYLGVQDTYYARRVGRWWLISAIARALDPGCQADHVLVLEGAQGAGKTTVFRILGGEYYDGSVPRLESTDGVLSFQGVWIREFAELAAFNRSDFQTIKAIITEKMDRFRPPYGRHFIEAPRRCVFCATVNPGEDWLKDPTGGRRFWPVRVGNIDLVGFSRDRDALLGEAREAFLSGEAYHPPREDTEIQETIQTEQSSRQQTDPWSNIVLQLAETGEHTPDAYYRALNIEVSKRSHQDANRIGKILRSAGYERAKIRNALSGSTEWVWRKGA